MRNLPDAAESGRKTQIPDVSDLALAHLLVPRLEGLSRVSCAAGGIGGSFASRPGSRDKGAGDRKPDKIGTLEGERKLFRAKTIYY